MPTRRSARPVSYTHLVTVNDYLARRDMEWMGPLYLSLGLTVNAIQSQMDAADRQKAYAAPLNGVGELLHVFSPTLVDEFRFGVNQAITHTTNLTDIPYSVNVSGFTALNADNTSDQDGTTFSWLDNLSWTHGKMCIRDSMIIDQAVSKGLWLAWYPWS